jgi:cytidine deaminase
MNDADKKVLDAAIAHRSRAYAPYSKFYVGVALRLKDGRIFGGLNVENCSYGLSVCAERHAVAAAVAGGARPGDIDFVVVVGDAAGPFSPCGACRQVLLEFANGETPILLHNLRGPVSTRLTVGELLPHAFSPSSLGDL